MSQSDRLRRAADGTGGTTTGAADGDTTGRKKPDPETRRKRDAARRVLADAVNNNKVSEAIADAIKTLVNVEPKRAPNSVFTRILEWMRKNKTQNGMDMFKEFRVGNNEMKQAIYSAQDENEWISGVTDKKGDTVYTYLGNHDEMPDGYPGPIRRQRNKDSEDNE